jgi:hypothetical protein
MPQSTGEPTVQQIFGAGAVETPTSLTIQKSDLRDLVPLPQNTAESMLVAINLNAADGLSGDDGSLDPTGTVAYEFPTFGDVTQRKIVMTLTERKRPTKPSNYIDPNKY